HSLGSKITFDTLTLLAEQLSRGDKTQAAQLTNLAAKVTYLIMFANQIPLLRLGETNALPESGPAEKSKTVEQFVQIRQESVKQAPVEAAGLLTPELRVIAVTDPNDLLSYPLQRSDLFTSTRPRFGNVFVCNAPSFLGLIANPVDAHEGYFENQKLINLLIRGYKQKPTSDIHGAGLHLSP